MSIDWKRVNENLRCPKCGDKANLVAGSDGTEASHTHHFTLTRAEAERLSLPTAADAANALRKALKDASKVLDKTTVDLLVAHSASPPAARNQLVQRRFLRFVGHERVEFFAAILAHLKRLRELEKSLDDLIETTDAARNNCTFPEDDHELLCDFFREVVNLAAREPEELRDEQPTK